MTELMRTPQEVYQDQLEQSNKLLQAGAIEQETYNRALSAYEDALKQATQANAQFQQQFVLIFSQGLFAFMEDGFDNMLKSFERALQRMAAMAASIELGKLLFGQAETGGGLLSLLPFGGFFARGGQVKSGLPIVVGEQGPELFVPAQSGNIVPNKSLNSAQANITVNMNISTPDVNSFRQSEASLGAQMLNALERAKRQL